MIHLKSDRELELLQASADLVGRTLGEVAKHVRPGISTLELDAVAEKFITDAGAVPSFKGYKVGNREFPSTLCTSVNSAVVHGIPNEEPLKEGDLVSVDCGVFMNGYHGDSAYTFAVGEISDEDRRLLNSTYESLMLGIEASKAGNRIGDIGHAVQSKCESDGYGVVFELVGHGIGTSLHEEPQIPNIGRAGNGKKLKDRLTICIEPMINQGVANIVTDEDGWTIRTADGKNSAHYEHMIAIDGGTPRILTTFSYIEDAIEAPYKLSELREEVYG